MTTTEADLNAALGQRLRDLCAWLAGALGVGELRDDEAVKLAKEAFLKRAYESWDGGNGDHDGALVWALEGYVEDGVSWADTPGKLKDDLSLSAHPPWEVAEFRLLVASALADKALQAFERGTKKQVTLAAMLYADAVEAREWWDKLRGPAGARNPDTRLGKVHARLLAVDEVIAVRKGRKLTAQKAAKAKLAKDPKQAAKTEAYKLWQDWQSRKTLHKSGAAFARYVVDLTAIEDTGTVQRWMRIWREKHRPS